MLSFPQIGGQSIQAALSPGQRLPTDPNFSNALGFGSILSALSGLAGDDDFSDLFGAASRGRGSTSGTARVPKKSGVF